MAMFDCSEFVQSYEKGGAQSIRDACNRCGRTKAAHEITAVEPQVRVPATVGSRTIQYRALLIGVPGLERPKEVYTTCLENLDSWVKATLGAHSKDYPEARIEVYRTQEFLAYRISGRVSETGGMVLNSESLLDPR